MKLSSLGFTAWRQYSNPTIRSYSSGPLKCDESYEQEQLFSLGHKILTEPNIREKV